MSGLECIAALLSNPHPNETLEQREMRERAGVEMSRGNATEAMRLLALSYDAHTVQMMNVEKVREVIADLTTYGSAGSDYYSADALQDCINDAADKLTAALQEKGNVRG